MAKFTGEVGINIKLKLVSSFQGCCTGLPNVI